MNYCLIHGMPYDNILYMESVTLIIGTSNVQALVQIIQRFAQMKKYICYILTSISFTKAGGYIQLVNREVQMMFYFICTSYRKVT